jgi:glycine cleavage system H protein
MYRLVLANTPFLFTTANFVSSITLTAHEYAKVDGKIATCGITDFAQAALGDIVFVDLPEVGDEFSEGDAFGSVESVKAASDVYAAVSGTIVEVNNVLSDEPGLVNSEAEGTAWFVKIEMSDDGELSDLMTPEAYKEHCEKESH